MNFLTNSHEFFDSEIVGVGAQKKNLKQIVSSSEAQTGFEPVNQGVADPRLTAWLLRRIYLTIKVAKYMVRQWCFL